MNKLGKIGLSLLALLAVSSCADPIEKVVQQNLEGFNVQDIEQVMSTIDERSPDYQATAAKTKELIEGYNLEYEIKSMSIIRKPVDESKQAEKLQAENQDATGLDNLLDDAAITEEDRAKQEERKREEAEKMQNKALTAEVKVVQVTRSKDNTGRYRDNQINVIHTLHKYPTDPEPVWKIYKSEVTAVDPVSKEG